MSQHKALCIRPNGLFYYVDFSDDFNPLEYITDINLKKDPNFIYDGYIPYTFVFNYYTYTLHAAYLYISPNTNEYPNNYNMLAQEFCSKTTNIDQMNIIIVGEMLITKDLNGRICDMKLETFERIKKEHTKPTENNCVIL